MENRDIDQIGQPHVEYVIPENFSLDGDETFIIETDNISVSSLFNILFLFYSYGISIKCEIMASS